MFPSAEKNLSKPRFLLDENVDIRVASYLRERNFFVLTCPKGLENGAVASLAQEESCLLLTNDKDFADPNLFEPSKLPGIIVFRIHPPELDRIVAALDKLFSRIAPAELAGKLVVLGEEGMELFG